MARPYTTQYYFNRTRDLQGFEHISTDGAVMLDQLCGETIASAMCDNDCSLEMVRFSRHGEQLIIHRRLTDIRAQLTIWR